MVVVYRAMHMPPNKYEERNSFAVGETIAHDKRKECIMKQIHSLNSITVPFSIQQIWKSITDITSYSLWWPSSVKIKVLNSTQDIVGSKVEVRHYGGLPFFCEFSEYFDNDKLVMKYSGIYSGFGVWTLTEMNGRTKIDYEINLEINNLFIRLLSYVAPIEKIHYKLMDEVLLGLEKRLEIYTKSDS